MKYTAAVFTGNGYRMRHIADITADTLPQLKQKASHLCNGYFNTLDRLEIIYRDEYYPTEYHVVLFRHNRKCPNNTITRDKWR